MATPYLGEIRMGGWNFPPRGNIFCWGQLLSIQQNAALFSLLGTQYGGNGTQTFAVPNLQSRVPIHFGQGPSLSNYVMGQAAGTETVTLLQAQLPQHGHPATFTPTAGTLNVTSAKANAAQAAAAQGSVLGRGTDGSATPAAVPRIYAPATSTPTVPLGGLNVAGTVAVTPTGGNQPHPNVQPYNTITYIIATQGIFPSRN